jgi:transcription initiation factor IIE alpha subunit
MPARQYNLPIEMVLKKFYCHKCGETLLKSPHTRIINRDDADYDDIRNTFDPYCSGAIEITKYNFRCPKCHNIISFNKQRAIAEIQKILRKKVLTKEEISDNADIAIKRRNTKDKVNQILWILFCFAVFICLYYCYIH